MGTGYTRNDTSNNIADGNIINAADLDGEFDAIESAFGTSGHTHDGTSAEGGPITVLGPVQDFVASATEIKPKTTNTLDIGTSALLFKDLFLDGVATLGSIKIDNAGTIGSASDGDAIAISSGGVVSFSQNTIGKTGSGHVLSIQTSHTTMESGDVLGKIEFSAPDEASGTDAILVGASIEALAEDTFSSSVNSSALVFKTNTSGAATERMRLTSAGDLHFLDNRKAIFGAGSDLRIYHDGTDTQIDNNTGTLIVRSSAAGTIEFRDQGSQVLAQFNDNSDVKLYHNNNEKLATTSTGIDVTGTVTADGLTVESGGNTLSSTGNNVQFNRASGSSFIDQIGASGSLLFRTTASQTSRLKIDNNGDISFYEDTGSTAKLTWDSSAEGLWLQGYGTSTTPAGTPSAINDAGLYFANNGGNARWALLPEESAGEDTLNLFADVSNVWTPVISFSRTTQRVGIGTDSPSATLDVSGAIRSTDRISGDGSEAAPAFRFTTDTNTGMFPPSGGDAIGFSTGGSERMRIDSSGNLLFGQSALIGQNTSDGSDNRYIFLAGGGSQSVARGGSVRVYGNEETNTGDVQIYSGNASSSNITINAYGSSSTIQFTTDGGTEAMRINSNQKVIIGDTSTRGTYGLTVAEPSDGVRIFGIASGGMDALHFDQARGSVASPTASNADGDGSYLSFSSYDGTNFDDIGSLAVVTDGAQDSGRMIFRTTPTGGSQTERLRIDSDGNILHQGGSPEYHFGTSSASHYNWRIAAQEAVSAGFEIASGTQSAGSAALSDTYTTRFVIKADTGSVIVGGITDGAAGSVTLENDGDIRGVLSSGAGGDTIISAISGVSNGYQIVVDTSNNQTYRWHNGGTQSMTLDSSGNLLVGHTGSVYNNVNSTSTEGISLTENGEIFACSSQSSGVMILNRKSTDGNILTLDKDGSTVGSIGTASSTTYIAGDASGIRLGSTAFMPSTAAGANKDNSVDLGHSAVRFKDLYLSGGVYLGGTGSANKLDDYEEGTWTPVYSTSGGGQSVTYNNQLGIYTKIGDLVTVHFNLDITSATNIGSGDVIITGLPFTSGSTSATSNYNRSTFSTYGIDYDSTDGHQMHMYIPTTNVSKLQILYSKDNAAWSVATTSNFNIGTGRSIIVMGSLSYYTDS